MTVPSCFDDSDEDEDIYSAADTEVEVIEDSYEVPPSILQELPDSDDKKWPQENKQYFATKKYVRKDKYKLEHLLPKEMKLPPLSSIYKM
jgi:hypothetical protein